MALLVVGGRCELRDADVSRVEHRDEALDRAALARGVPPLEEDADRRPQTAVAGEPGEVKPELEQAPLRG